jgi:hypothetical protein
MFIPVLLHWAVMVFAEIVYFRDWYPLTFSMAFQSVNPLSPTGNCMYRTF